MFTPAIPDMTLQFLYVPALLLTWLVIVIIMYFKKKHRYWSQKDVYTEKPQMPFGNAKRLFLHEISLGQEFENLYNTAKKKNLAFCGYYAFAKPIFVPIDLDIVKDITNTHFDHFTDRSVYSNPHYEPITGNLFTLKGLVWRRLRTKLTPTFTSSKIKVLFPTLLQCSSSLCEAVDQQMAELGTVNVRDIIARYTTDVIGSCAFGINCNSLENPGEQLRLLGKQMFDVSKVQNSLAQLMTIIMPEFLQFFKITLLDKRTSNIFTRIVTDTVSYREQNKIVRNDFMQLLIEMKNKTGDQKRNKSKIVEHEFTLDEIVAQCFIFFVAGFETPSSGATFCLYEIAANPSVQNKLRDEIVAVLQKHRGCITYDSLMEMTYMDKCISEALRKYPPSPVITRKCTKPYAIPNSDVVIDKDTTVVIPLFGIHHDAEYFPDPEVFDPERFSEENKAGRHPSAWIPFGDGPRICIASRFGFLQIKACLVALLSKYELTLNSKTEQPLQISSYSSAVVAPKCDLLIDFKKLH